MRERRYEPHSSTLDGRVQNSLRNSRANETPWPLWASSNHDPPRLATTPEAAEDGFRPGSIARDDPRLASCRRRRFRSRDLHIKQRPSNLLGEARKVLQRRDPIVLVGPVAAAGPRRPRLSIVEERGGGPHQLAGVQGLLAEAAELPEDAAVAMSRFRDAEAARAIRTVHVDAPRDVL